MERHSQVSEHKKKKLNRKDDHTHRHKRSLNDFPDAILCHILSYLPTDLAVSTSVLSKRWRFLWTSQPSLDFCEEASPYYYQENSNSRRTRRNSFMNFVERVLTHHNAPQIENFSLSCYLEDDVLLIKKWISTALSRNPKEFDISLVSTNANDQNVFPHSLFICETLEVLKISTKIALTLPSRISLPNLKELTLEGIKFENSHESNHLFSSSAMEILVVDNCKLEGGVPWHLVISAPNLRSLIIDESETDGLASVTICAELRTFYYSCRCIKDFRFTCPSSIKKATLQFDYIPDTDAGELHHHHFQKVMKLLRFVKYLELPARAIEGLSYGRVPIFKNLISLEVFNSPEPEEQSFEGLELILSKCPRLENLILPRGILDQCDINSLINPSLACLSSLKHIKVGCIRGETRELVTLLILLTNASSLETMTIGLCTEDISESERKKTKTFLSAIPKASESCKLIIKSLCYLDRPSFFDDE